MRIFKNAWFHRFARDQNITDHAIRDAVRRAESGQIDADLGGGVVKQRVARQGHGKSKGYRTVILYRAGERAIFVYGFSKSQRKNIKKKKKKKMELSEEQLDELVTMGKFEEI